MLRRSLTFTIALALIAGVSFLVYFNGSPATVKLAPGFEFTLPLGWLILTAITLGGIAIALLLVLREGRWALRQWRVERAKRLQERNSQYKAEARALSLAGQFDKARKLLTKASKNSGSEVVDLIEIAETYLDEGRPAEARTTVEKGIRDFGNDPLLLHTLAKAAAACGDNAASIAALERARTAFPGSLAIHEMLRDALVSVKSWRRAEAPQARIVELRPSDQREKERLLEIRFNACLTEPASERIASLRALNSIDGDFAPAVVEWSRVVADGGDAKSALKIIEKGLRRKVQDPLLAQGEHLLQDDAEQRMRFLRKYVAAEEGGDLAKKRLLKLLLKTGHLDDAATLLTELGETDPGIDVQMLKADLAIARADNEQAARLFREVAVAALTRSS
jgi:tetratricopeptide (TPR) repeat protein